MLDALLTNGPPLLPPLCAGAGRRTQQQRRRTLLFSAAALIALHYVACVAVPYVKRRRFRQQLQPPGAAEAAVVDWPELLSVLQDDLVRGSSAPTYLIVHLQYGLGNRLRALASAMAVAAASNRPLAVIWPRDAHCNASFHQLFDAPVLRRFAVLDVDGEAAQQAIWASVQRESATFTAYSYMREDGIPIKENGQPDRQWLGRYDHSDKHLYVKSAYLLSHPRGTWAFAAWQLNSLVPRPEVAAQLVARREMVGVHVRSVVDTGKAYGSTPLADQQEWRTKGAWPNFVDRMAQEPPATKFYLAADSQAAYDGLMARFPGRIVRTPRACPPGGAGCEARDAASIVSALVDMLNLARTRRILGSGYSSFSEAAQHYGSIRAHPLWGPLGPADWSHFVPKVEVAGTAFGPGSASLARSDVDDSSR